MRFIFGTLNARSSERFFAAQAGGATGVLEARAAALGGVGAEAVEAFFAGVLLPPVAPVVAIRASASAERVRRISEWQRIHIRGERSG